MKPNIILNFVNIYNIFYKYINQISSAFYRIFLFFRICFFINIADTILKKPINIFFSYKCIRKFFQSFINKILFACNKCNIRKFLWIIDFIYLPESSYPICSWHIYIQKYQMIIFIYFHNISCTIKSINIALNIIIITYFNYI